MQCLLLVSLTWTILLLQEFPYKQATIEVNTQNLLGDIYSTHAQHLRKALTFKKKNTFTSHGLCRWLPQLS